MAGRVRMSLMPKNLWVRLLAVGLLVAGVTVPAVAWTPNSQVSIAESAARLAPPDLLRLLAKHREDYREGVMAAFRDKDARSHFKDLGGRGSLDKAWQREVENAIAAIEAHRPFSEVVYRLGMMAHYLTDANNPLNVSSADSLEPKYFADFSRYLESAEPRFQAVFYGLRPELEGGKTLNPLLEETFERSQSLYRLVGQEYRRFPKIDGRRNFDDRSTAFGVAALCYSHAVSDIAEALRYIWLKSGGADSRRHLPERGKYIVLLPRGDAPAPSR